MQPVNGMPDGGTAAVTGCGEFDYAPGQPNLYRMMRYKQDLVAGNGVEKAFETFARRFGLPDTIKLRQALVESERAVAKRDGICFAETGPSGEPFAHAAPRVVGEGNQRPLSGTTRSRYIACLSDARVRGRSSLIDLHGRLLLDVQNDEAERTDDELEWDPAVFHADGRRVWCIAAADEAYPLEIDEAFSLLGAHSDFFGHWMYEYLPKYVAARMSGFLPETAVLIDAHMPPSHREALALLFGDTRVIEVPAFRSVLVRKLWCAPTLSYMPLHEVRNERFCWDALAAPPARFEPVIREMQRRFDARAEVPPGIDPRVYLARRPFRHRRLVNADAIERIAGELGFAIAYPEDLTFTAQAALARRADVIVAPEGSAIYLAFLARPGTTLCVLCHPLTDSLGEYSGLFSALQVDVVVVTGPIARPNLSTPNDSDYRLDEDTFRQTVRRVIDEQRERGGSSRRDARE